MRMANLYPMSQSAKHHTSTPKTPAETTSQALTSVELLNENEHLKQELRARFEEIAYLTKTLNGLEYPDPHADARYIAELRHYVSGLETAYTAILNSTSWKITAPLRAFARYIKRQPLPAPFQTQLHDIIDRNTNSSPH